MYGIQRLFTQTLHAFVQQIDSRCQQHVVKTCQATMSECDERLLQAACLTPRACILGVA
jgi:hypothetical protein